MFWVGSAGNDRGSRRGGDKEESLQKWPVEKLDHRADVNMEYLTFNVKNNRKLLPFDVFSLIDTLNILVIRNRYLAFDCSASEY